jgi:late competence protein required for DNA uptake (superfamily II DNA/RNA helicase)
MNFSSTCDRCHKDTNTTQMSLFNTQMCCPKCIEIERAHKMFKEARKAELDELSKGNYNFPGIGLPKDLEVNS